MQALLSKLIQQGIQFGQNLLQGSRNVENCKIANDLSNNCLVYIHSSSPEISIDSNQTWEFPMIAFYVLKNWILQVTWSGENRRRE